MNIKDKQTQLALALLLRILLTTTDAVVAPSQYSSYQPQSYYSHSLSGYGNENQNYFDDPGELNPANGYTNEPYQREHFASTSYGSNGVDFDAGDEKHAYQDSYQSQRSYQDYLGGHFLPFRQEQDSASHHADDGGGRTSLVSFDNIDFNKSKATNYKPTEDVLYPPLVSEMHHQQQPPRQQHLQSADYMTAENYMPPSTSSHLNPLQYLFGERILQDNAVRPLTPLRTTQMSIQHQTNAKLYIDNDNQQQHQQDLQQIPRTSQHQPQSPPHYESQFTNNSDRLSNSSPSRTYYVADSDLSDSSRNHPADAAHAMSLLQSHLAQLPVVSSPTVQVPDHPPTSFSIPSEPIPISKHVEITKHVPVPIYRQIHVPVRQPVRFEIPRPVISTIPRPYPIQIPTITKTIAVPLVKEVKIPVEKVTPYPVEHRVPYVVEKRVPFQIERQVAAPIYYPFPVKVPMVRTILHKKKAHLPPMYYHQRIHM